MSNEVQMTEEKWDELERRLEKMSEDLGISDHFSRFGHVVKMGDGYLISPLFYEALDDAKKGDFKGWEIIYDVFALSDETQAKWKGRDPETCVREAIEELKIIEASEEYQLKRKSRMDAYNKAFQRYTETGDNSELLKWAGEK